MEYVVIGKIINTHGIKGDLKIASYSDFDDERYKVGETVYIGEDYLPMEIISYRKHQGFLLVCFKDYEDINLVEKYKNLYVYKSKNDIKPLKKGEYYYSDLRDLDVYVDNNKIGKVLRVEDGIRNNYLRILKDDNQKEYLVPFLPQFVMNVDIEKNKVDVIKMDGLL